MSPIFNAIAEIENATVTIEQLRDVLSVLQERYFDQELTDNTSKHLFVAGQTRMGNIISFVETQLNDICKHLIQNYRTGFM